MFDADAAGQRAALRGIDVAFNAALGVDVAVLPKGEDPDSYIRRHGADAMRRILSSGIGIVEYRIESERTRFPGGRLDFLAQERLVKEFGELAQKIDDPTRREAFLAGVSSLLELDISVVRQTLKLVSPAKVRKEAPIQREILSKQAEFIRVLLESPDYVKRARVSVVPEDFDHAVLREMYDALLERTADGFWPTTPQEIGTTPDQIEHWSRLMTHAVDPENCDRIFEDGLRAFAQNRRQAPQIRKLIAQAERAGDSATARELTERLAETLRLDKKEPTSSPER